MRIPTWNIGGGQCTREDDEVYNNGAGIPLRRADIVHSALFGYPNVVELKCQSWLQDHNDITSLANNINTDIAKIAHANRNAAQYQNANWYVVGIAVDIHGGAVAHAKQFNFGQATRWTQANAQSPIIFWCTY